MIPIAFASLVVRSGCETATASLAVRRSGETAAARIAVAVRGTSTSSPGFAGTTRIPAARDREACVGRLAPDGLRQPREVRLGPRARDRQFPRAVSGQREDLGDPPARQAPARLAVGEPDGSGECDAGLGRDWGELRGGDLGRVDPDRQRNGAAALERGERAHEHGPGGNVVEMHPALSWDDGDLEAVADERGLDVVAVDRLGELAELVVERGVVDGDGRLDLGAEDADVQTAEAADGAEALALVPGGGDGGTPVGLDAESGRRDPEPLAARLEHDGPVGELVRARLQRGDGLVGRQAADVDARDRDALGEPVGRACEDESDHRGDDCGHGAERDCPAQSETGRGGPSQAESEGGGVGSHYCVRV